MIQATHIPTVVLRWKVDKDKLIIQYNAQFDI